MFFHVFFSLRIENNLYPKNRANILGKRCCKHVEDISYLFICFTCFTPYKYVYIYLSCIYKYNIYNIYIYMRTYIYFYIHEYAYIYIYTCILLSGQHFTCRILSTEIMCMFEKFMRRRFLLDCFRVLVCPGLQN